MPSELTKQTRHMDHFMCSECAGKGWRMAVRRTDPMLQAGVHRPNGVPRENNGRRLGP